MIKTIKKHGWTLGLTFAAIAYILISYHEIATPSHINAAQLPAVKPGLDDIIIEAKPGAPLLINFFASWCHICDTEPPALRELDRMVRQANGRLIGVASRDSRGALLSSGKLSERPYPLALDRSGDYAEQLRLDGVPQTILVDQTGKIVYHVRGQLDRYHVGAIAQHLKSLKSQKNL